MEERLAAAGIQPAITLLGVSRLFIPSLLVEMEAELWVPNRSSTAVTCGIIGQRSSGMIAGHGVTTALSDLPPAPGLARFAGT
jgi:hypothetical protein